MYLNDILEFESITIKEDNYNVLEWGEINFHKIKSANDFSLGYYEVDFYENDYNNADIKYSIYKNYELIKEKLSEEEVREFLKELEEKYKDYNKKEKTLLEQREELLIKQEEERIKKEKQQYIDAYKEYSKIINDEEFKKILRKTLVEYGAADIPTCCLCGRSGCIDADVLKTYFKVEIKEYEKEGIYVRFPWNCIEFSLYENKGWSSYSIIKDEEKGGYKLKYHAM